MKKICAYILAFLLTGSLALFGVTFACSGAVEPGLRNGGALPSDEVIKQEEKLIRERVTELGVIYGFSPDTVMPILNSERIGELNRQAALWWNNLLKNGSVDSGLEWDTEELAQVLRNDPGMAGGEEDEEETDSLVYKAAGAVRESVNRVILPLRIPIMIRGMKEVNLRADVPNLIQFLTGLPGTALALAALLAGLLALLESRRLRSGLKYIGGAMGGAALVLAMAIILVKRMNLSARIREASESLAIQYGALAGGAMLRICIVAAVLLAGGILCLILYRKGAAKTEEAV